MTLKHGWKLHARGAVWRNFRHLADMAEDVRYQSDVELTFNVNANASSAFVCNVITYQYFRLRLQYWPMMLYVS
ncbi:MAG TPA: hypothetical protein DD666_21780 [Advenella kashmirensis]|uniref:Uncharacterized protein n=1 Tax=Advenella kashmirensis TaxID=310575 RepID=A0A356LM05_9BURK|nr:hypothetical protein [Advenella kashmirensis]